MRAQPYRTERFTFEGHDLVYDVYDARPVLRVSSSVARRVPATRFGPLNSALHAVALTPEVVAAVMHGVLVRPVAPTQEQRARIVAPTLILAHRNDLLHPFNDAANLARQLPHAELVPARSPFELRLRPERLTDCVAQFLRDVPDRANGRDSARWTGATP